MYDFTKAFISVGIFQSALHTQILRVEMHCVKASKNGKLTELIDCGVKMDLAPQKSAKIHTH